jgi:hypothetical protein
MDSLRGRLQALVGRDMGLALVDGTRLDDCELVSQPRARRIGTAWIVHGGHDVFVPGRCHRGRLGDQPRPLSGSLTWAMRSTARRAVEDDRHSEPQPPQLAMFRLPSMRQPRRDAILERVTVRTGEHGPALPHR